MATVSVCIVTYNSAADIRSCMEAVFRQTMPIQTIVVVDNASSDESTAVVKSMMNQSTSVTLIENKVNNGFAGGQNQAISATNTDYVLVLNPDVELEPNYIHELVNRLEQESMAGSATGLLLSKADPSLVDTAGLAMGLNRHAVDRGMGESSELWQTPGKAFGPSGAAALYKRRMINDILLNGEFFDEHFFAYKEDVDVAWRSKLLGWSSYYVPGAVGYHARGWQKGGRRSVSLFVRRHSYMNQLFMIVKNEQPGWHWVGLLPVLAAREAAKLMYMLLRERDMLSCWPVIIKLLPVMVSKRKELRLKLFEKKKV